MRSLGSAVVTQSPPTSEVSGSNPDDLMWEGWLLFADGWRFTVQNLDQLYVLVSSAHKTTRHHMTCTVLKGTQNPK